MISKAYWSRFFESSGDKLVAIARALGHTDANKPEDFITALADLQKRCKRQRAALSGYGVQQADFGKYADNAIETMGGLFRVDPRPLTREDIIAILAESYK